MEDPGIRRKSDKAEGHYVEIFSRILWNENNIFAFSNEYEHITSTFS